MSRTASDVLLEYFAAQSRGDVDRALELIAPHAVFDVGRGRYEGEGVRSFHERLRQIRSETRVITLEARGPGRVAGLVEQRDDDLGPLGIDALHLEVEAELDDSGRISAFRARPTPQSLASIAAAREAGRSSEGAELAERAGNLPPPGKK